MLALARNHITDSLDNAANDDCINGGPCNRTKYGYDALDRLTSATTSSITDGWTYDASGNRLTQTGTTATTFSVNSTNNQLSSSSGSLARPIYVYDAAGHTQAYGSYVFTYNNRGRLMATNAGPTNYLYNALGQMIEKSGTAGTTLFMQDEAGHLIGEYDGVGNLIEETIWLGDIPVATLQFGTSALKTYYVHTDHLNTPRRITNRNTNIIVWRWDSDPFGNGAAVQNPQGTVTVLYNLRFPGQYYQAETGLSQNYFRDFDPAVGGYVESDPIGLAGGSRSTYSYVKDNPISLTDPTGLVVQRCCRRARIAFGLLPHCWLKTDTKVAGMNATAECSLPGENRSDWPWITPVVVSDASCEASNNCQTINDVDEDCVNRELVIGRSLGYFGGSNNCVTFAWEVLTKCSKNKQPALQPPPRFEGR